MKSRKRVLMNLFAGKEFRYRCKERTRGQWGKQPVGRVEKVALTYVRCHACGQIAGEKLLYIA